MRLDFLPRLQMMPIYYPAGCEGQEDLVDYACSDCNDGGKEKSQVRGVAFVEEGHAINTPAVAAEWLAGMESRAIRVIPAVVGSLTVEAIEGPGYGDQRSRVSGFNFTLTFRDPEYKDNADFYNGLIARRGYRAAYRTETLGHLSDPPTTIIAVPVITDNPDDDAVYEVTVKWTQRKLPVPFVTPPNVFRCFSITEPAPE